MGLFSNISNRAANIRQQMPQQQQAQGQQPPAKMGGFLANRIAQMKAGMGQGQPPQSQPQEQEQMPQKGGLFGRMKSFNPF